jgi:hypothetical protein
MIAPKINNRFLLNIAHLAESLNLQFGLRDRCSKGAEAPPPAQWGRTDSPHSGLRKSGWSSLRLFTLSRISIASSTQTVRVLMVHIVDLAIIVISFSPNGGEMSRTPLGAGDAISCSSRENGGGVAFAVPTSDRLGNLGT